MCIETLPKEKECFNKTIKIVINSIDKGERKLFKIFKTENNDKLRKTK